MGSLKLKVILFEWNINKNILIQIQTASKIQEVPILWILEMILNWIYICVSTFL